MDSIADEVDDVKESQNLPGTRGRRKLLFRSAFLGRRRCESSQRLQPERDHAEFNAEGIYGNAAAYG